MRIEDRRRLARIEYDPETAIADWRQVRAAGVRPERTLLGTAGERIAIERLLWVGGEPGGRFEIEFVWVSEVNETGHFSATVAFDPEDARAAQREAWARWAAVDPAAYAVAKPIDELTDACDEKDPLKFRACLDDDIVADDHRLAGIGRIRGADAYLEAVRVLWELAPDTRGEMGMQWPAFGRHGSITVLRRGGRLPEGGSGRDLDSRAVPSGAREAAIEREERRGERLRECQISGVVGRDARAKLPDPRQKEIVRMPRDVEICEIFEGLAPPLFVDRARQRVPAQYLRDL